LLIRACNEAAAYEFLVSVDSRRTGAERGVAAGAGRGVAVGPRDGQRWRRSTGEVWAMSDSVASLRESLLLTGGGGSSAWRAAGRSRR
jgi:hypothetical protein